MLQLPAISGAVEGPVDEAVLQRLILHSKGIPTMVYGKKGKPHLLKSLAGYNAAAQRSPWIVLVDLDKDGTCVGPLLGSWLPTPAPYMCFRVAVKAIESWLIADRETLATFLGVALSKVPQKPDLEPNPKDTVINLARISRKKNIREGMVPRPGSGRMVGPLYTSFMIEFTTNHWQPDVAAANSDSLHRALNCIQQLISKAVTTV
ncbi:MAG: hypothetical protein DLM69_08525 [Candidatus Chloroheliales bacterium]|nr:MAG: hypothetical protein DLM69_08525 [Chloroflexota bacterium]